MMFLKIPYSWLILKKNVDLCYSSRNKFNIKILLSYWILVGTCRILIWMIMITVLFLSYTAYRFYDFSSIGLCLYLILFYRLYYPSYHLIILGIYLCYIMISYVNYKFDEILKSLRLSILWNNKRSIVKNIVDHHNLVVITQKFSYMMNSIIGLIHSIIPYIMVLVIKIIMLPTIPGYLKYYFIVLIITYIAFI